MEFRGEKKSMKVQTVMLCENLRDRYIIFLPLTGKGNLLCVDSAFEIHVAAHCNIQAAHCTICAPHDWCSRSGEMGQLQRQSSEVTDKDIKTQRPSDLSHHMHVELVILENYPPGVSQVYCEIELIHKKDKSVWFLSLATTS